MTKTFSIAEQTVSVERNGAKATVEFGSNPRNYAENYIVIALADGATIQLDFMRNGMHLRTEVKEPSDPLARLGGEREASEVTYSKDASGGPKPEEFQVKDVQGDTTEDIKALKAKATIDPDKLKDTPDQQTAKELGIDPKAFVAAQSPQASGLQPEAGSTYVDPSIKAVEPVNKPLAAPAQPVKG